MNKTDTKILRILNKNARESLSAIAKEVSLTENAVKYRIKKLQSTGILKQFTTDISAVKLGKSIQVIILLNVQAKDVQQSLKKISGYNEVSRVYRCTGEHSIICVGYFDDQAHLEKFLDEKLLIEVPITSWSEHIILKKSKEHFFNVDML